jgi:hypothetical protein
MAESLQSQTVIGFSTAPESGYGVNPVLASAFTPMVVTAGGGEDQPLPESEKSDDRGRTGRGNAMYPSFQRSGFRLPTSFTLADTVQAGTLAPLVRRFMGATSGVPTEVTPLLYFHHIFYELNPDTNLQLPSTSVIYQNNEYDYMHRGCVGSTLQVSQTGANDPTFSLGMTGAGVAERVSLIGGFGSLAIPPKDPYMYGASTAIGYTNDSAVGVSLTTPSHKWRGGNFNANNALITDDTRAGMPQADATEPRRGWYRDFLHFGDREISADFTMSMDGDYSLKNAEELNLEYTDFSWVMKGDIVPTLTEKYTVRIVIPKFNLRTPRTGTATGNKKTKTFTIFPLIHAGHYGVYRFEFVNGVSTAIL